MEDVTEEEVLAIQSTNRWINDRLDRAEEMRMMGHNEMAEAYLDAAECVAAALAQYVRQCKGEGDG